VINLSLLAFLLADSKEALQAVINATENSTSENVETALMLLLETSSILSPSNHTTDPVPATDVSHSQALDERLEEGEKAKDSAGDTTQVETDSGLSGIAPLKKLYNIAILLGLPGPLYRSWMSAIGIVLGIDNVTRWHGWFKMLDVATKNRGAITAWLMENFKDDGNNNLDESDWDLLLKMHKFLQPLTKENHLSEKTLSNLSNTATALDILLIYCRRTEVSGPNNLLFNTNN
jgi:hypothetical protein